MPSHIKPHFGLRGRDLGIDLGAVNILVYAHGKGVVVSEPTALAVDSATGEVLAIGAAARALAARTPDIVVLRTLVDGSTSEPGLVEPMIRRLLRRASEERGFPTRPRLVVGVYGGATDREKRAVKRAGIAAGAREVYTIEEPMAAGIGAGLPVNEPRGSMVVDVGGGRTQAAVLALGGVVIHRSSRVAGASFDRAVVEYARAEHNLLVGKGVAEGAKIVAGSACSLSHDRRVVLRGSDAHNGEARCVEVAGFELREAIAAPVEVVVGLVKAVLAAPSCAPELVADVMEHGITLTGGGALLLGLDRRLSVETGAPVRIAADPLLCVVRGAGLVAARLTEYRVALRAATSTPWAVGP